MDTAQTKATKPSSRKMPAVLALAVIASMGLGALGGTRWIEQRDRDAARLPEWFPGKATDESLNAGVVAWINRCTVRTDPQRCACILGHLFDGVQVDAADRKCEEATPVPTPEPAHDSPPDTEASKKQELTARALAERPAFQALKGQKAYDDWVGPEGIALTYHDLEKAVWRHIGQRVRFRGNVFHVREYENQGAMFQIDACPGWSHCNLMILYPKTDGAVTPVRENDQLWVYGYVLDEFSYESTAGHTLTVPRIVAVGGTWYR